MIWNRLVLTMLVLILGQGVIIGIILYGMLKGYSDEEGFSECQ